MRYIASGNEMSRIDAYTIDNIGIPQMVLMERAALEICKAVTSKFDSKSRILVVVESGNNGGDGIAAARMLVQMGYTVEVYWLNKLANKSEAFMHQYDIAKKVGVKIVDEVLNYGYDVLIDGIFGCGLNRAVIGGHAEVIHMMNDMDAYKIAIDIPSGIDADTGFILGTAVKVNETITFGLMKLGLLNGKGNEYAGNVKVVDIGFPKQAIDFISPKLFTYDEEDVDKLLPFRRADSHKGSYGKIGVIGGCKNMAGAAMFAAEAAYRMGCGLVRVCTVEDNRYILQTKLPEAMLTTYNPDSKESTREGVKAIMEWADVIVLGPGLGVSDCSRYIVEKVFRDFEKTIVLDADGINIVAENVEMLDNTKAKVVVTPHLAEMSRLTSMKTGEIKESKYDIAKHFAKEHNVTVVLKDSRTIVSNGETKAYINITGNNGMATGGSGDVLSGIIASLCGQGLDIYEAAKLGVYIHGLAGQKAAIIKGKYSMIASDIVKSIMKVLEGDYYAG